MCEIENVVQYKKSQIFLVENICWKVEHLHWNGGDWKGARKVELPYKEVYHKNPKEKTFLLVLSTQPKDHTKAHDRVVHPQA
jgi:hypothetical protein